MLMLMRWRRLVITHHDYNTLNSPREGALKI